MSKTAVVALGGNAITREDKEDTIPNQFAHTRASLSGLIELIRQGYNLALTHGNGPQVGNAILRVELARGKAPILPLGICVADTQGGIGYMIAQSLQNRLRSEGIQRGVTTIITQVIVDHDDPAMQKPNKFIGQFYSETEAEKFQIERNWQMKPDSNRGWRRVVPSPIPKGIIEAQAIKYLVDSGNIVIAAGGGGIPVYIMEDGNLEGVDVVIDKDRASALLASEIGASLLLLLTGVDKVALNYGKPNQQNLNHLTVYEAENFLSEGHFPAGSMGPKIEAAIKFIKEGGKSVFITSMENAAKALTGNAGTIIEAG